MGHGIAQVAAINGYRVILRDTNREALERGLRAIERSLAKGISLGKLTEDESDAALQRLRGTVNLNETRDADLFIEAVPETLELKQQTLRDVEEITADDRPRVLRRTRPRSPSQRLPALPVIRSASSGCTFLITFT
jgi:3-hydroxybutyryl-CoA dehydrogenase